MKICSRCKINKELIEFNKCIVKKDGLQIYCKSCEAQYYLDHKDRIAQYQLNHKSKRKQYLLDHKEKIVQQTAQYYLDHKDEIIQRQIQYRVNHKNKIAQYRIEHKDKMIQYEINHKEELSQYRVQYRLKYKNKIALYLAQYQIDHPEKYMHLPIRQFCSIICKPFILNRDNYLCQLCGNSNNLIVHHIRPVKDDTDAIDILNPKNLVTLCKTCHLLVHDGAFIRINKELAIKLIVLIEAKEALTETALPVFMIEK